MTPFKGSLTPSPALTEIEVARLKVIEYRWRYEHVIQEQHKKALLRKLNYWKKVYQKLKEENE